MHERKRLCAPSLSTAQTTTYTPEQTRVFVSYISQPQRSSPSYYSAHFVPFIEQNGIRTGSARIPLATNLSLISASLGLAVT